MPLPHSYSELYPSRFLKADLLKGLKVTLTIKSIFVEELIGENNKKDPKVIVSFVERPLELVFAKTNAICIQRMFGSDPHSAIGKQITLFPTTTKFGRETVECLRIWGSPQIAEDMPITVPQGRKKPLEMVMHRVMPGTCGYRGATPEANSASPPPPAAAPEPAPVPRDENDRPQYFTSAAFVAAARPADAPVDDLDGQGITDEDLPF